MSVVGQLYRIIIDDVIKNVKAEFAAEGLDDSVLQELQQTWELKLQQSGAVNLAAGEGVADYGQHAPYSYDLNTYNANFLNTAFPDLSHNPSLYNLNSQTYIPTAADMTAAPRPYPSTQSTQLAATALRSLNTNAPPPFEAIGKPQHYMPAPSWNSTPVNVNLADRSNSSNASIQNIIRQQDGASDQTQEDQSQASKSEETKQIDEMILQKYEEIVKKKAEKYMKTKTIPQVDGKSGSEDDSDNELGGDEELDSDLDDEDDTEPETENFVLCQYEKVTRIKNKRKTNLKDGIMHLNGRDYVFHKATGEFDW